MANLLTLVEKLRIGVRKHLGRAAVARSIAGAWDGQIKKIPITLEIARKREVGPWKEWYAWRPVKIKDKRVWLKKVYRRKINTYVDHDDWSHYEYGTVFDVLKEESK